MRQSFKYSQLCLRLGLAAVFLWFGIHKFINPTYWLNAWIPENVQTAVAYFKLSGTDFIYILGIFEVLVGTSLISTIFIRLFSVLAIIFLAVIFITNGFSEIVVRDLGLIGGFAALIFWPQRSMV